jgi:ornithine decarboxylase
MNLQKNIEIDRENDVDEYVNLLLYPIKDTITQFLNKKMSIKQMRIEKQNVYKHPEKINLQLVETFYKLFKTSVQESEVYPKFHTKNIQKIINYYIKKIIINTEAFYIVNLTDIRDKYVKWVHLLPNIKPFYAVKSNPDKKIIQLLLSMGAGMDCASMYEIKLALENGVAPSDIIYANPVKSQEYLLFAKDNGVDLMTFDCPEELYKIHKFYPSARLILRIKTDNKNAKCKLSMKFGIEKREIPRAIAVCQELGLNLVGISFHIGSNLSELSSLFTALSDSHFAFETALKYGFKLSILDIGGGYEYESLKTSYRDIHAKINELFLQDSRFDGVQIIAEPGRYFCKSSHTLVLNIIGKKTAEESRTRNIKYYLNDGIYGSMNNLERDYTDVEIKPVGEKKKPYFSSIFFGPTCDSYDTIYEKVDFPDCPVGDWVYIENMGAYTKAGASEFNGFPISMSYYYETQ